MGLYAPPPGDHGVLDHRQTNRTGTEYGEEALWDGGGNAGGIDDDFRNPLGAVLMSKILE